MRFDRACGVLLHPTCLPGPHGSGDFGSAAYHFVDWLVAAGQKLWQVLPLGDIGSGNSPYMSFSAFAGNPLLIDLVELQARGWLEAAELDPAGPRRAGLTSAGGALAHGAPPSRRRGLLGARDADDAVDAAFCARNAAWLDDYALFVALATATAGSLVRRDRPSSGASRRLARSRRGARRTHRPPQVLPMLLLRAVALRKADGTSAASRSSAIRPSSPPPERRRVGPGAAVRARPEGDDHGIAGVPPDYFAVTGQRWGNPLYAGRPHRRRKASLVD